MLIGLPDFSCFKIFTFQCFKSVTPFVVQKWYPPTTAVHLQTPILDSLLLQAAVVQINEGLYFRSPRLATRFESNAAYIVKVLVKALLNLIIKFNIQENQVVKNGQDYVSFVFSLKIHCQKRKTLCDRRIYHHVSCSQLFSFFPLGLCRRQPRNHQIHRQVC